MFNSHLNYTHKPSQREVRVIMAEVTDECDSVWVCFVDDPDTGFITNSASLEEKKNGLSARH